MSVDEFSTRFSKQAGVIHQVKNLSEAVSVINDLIKSRGKGESCASDEIDISFGSLKSNISNQLNTTINFNELKTTPRKLIGQIDVGITKAEYGIAETGSIVDISYSDEHRLLSSLTRVHIALLEEDSIVEKLSKLSLVMRDLLDSKKKSKPSITFIGGPSRTSDIELKSVLGVHGPHEVHVVLAMK